jgi:hypothetical protein
VKTGGGGVITVLDEFWELGVGLGMWSSTTSQQRPLSLAYIVQGTLGVGDGVKTGGGGVVGASCGGGGGLGRAALMLMTRQ